MKKYLFTLLMLMTPMSFIEAQNQEQEEEQDEVILELEFSFGDNSGTHNPLPKAPIRMPKVYKQGCKLSFLTSCNGCNLQLVNEEDEIEYSIIIPSNTNTVELPSYLSGEYRIEIIRGRFIFWGIISF